MERGSRGARDVERAPSVGGRLFEHVVFQQQRTPRHEEGTARDGGAFGEGRASDRDGAVLGVHRPTSGLGLPEAEGGAGDVHRALEREDVPTVVRAAVALEGAASDGEGSVVHRDPSASQGRCPARLERHALEGDVRVVSLDVQAVVAGVREADLLERDRCPSSHDESTDERGLSACLVAPDRGVSVDRGFSFAVLVAHDLERGSAG